MDMLEPPTVDDRAIWDLWLSQFRLPVVLVADELGVFEFLERRPAGLADVRAFADVTERAAEALLAVLAALGFVVRRRGRFHLTDAARTYLLPGRPFYWLPMLREVGNGQLLAELLGRRLREDNLAPEAGVSRRWERGEMSAEDARLSCRRMHSHSLPAATGLARNGDFGGVRRLLDVAGGSGCFSIALALRHPELRCTVAELPVVAAETREYIRRFGCADRVGTHEFNMFRDPWPEGYDAIFFSNVFHDWDAERRQELARRSFAALPPRGRIYLHEMLLDDERDGPLTPALFSLLMLGTRGKQFSAEELGELLARAGFVDVAVTHSYGYYSLVRGTKPG
jgi:3-hydroxy-5-methyl-1-naphthoate 3-O-methyltransferase